ncbi:MAG: hypothetical protein ABIG39_02055 [Candidatus Micrarchaeota archaeon]
MKNRGQAATEYLIILAVVVIIALIVVGVLGGFQGLSGGITRQQSEAYWSSIAEIGILPNYKISPALAEITVKNNRPFTVQVSSVIIDNAGVISPQGLTIPPGLTGNINVSGHSCIIGEPYAFNIRILYVDPSTGRQFTFRGQNPLVGTCE